MLTSSQAKQIKGVSAGHSECLQSQIESGRLQYKQSSANHSVQSTHNCLSQAVSHQHIQQPYHSNRHTEELWWKGTAEDYFTQPPCSSKVTCRMLSRTMSCQVMNISKDGDSRTSLGTLFQCSTTLTAKKYFLTCKWNFLCCILCPKRLVLSLGIAEKSLVLVYQRKKDADFPATVLPHTHAFLHCLLELCSITIDAIEMSSIKHFTFQRPCHIGSDYGATGAPQ